MIRKPLFFTIGLRYSGALGSSGFASFVSLMSIIGVFLGVAALIVVTSVMNGLEDNMKSRTLSVVSHVLVSNGGQGKSFIDNNLEKMLMSSPGVVTVAPVIETEAIVQSSKMLTAVSIMAVDPSSYPDDDLIRRSTSFDEDVDRISNLSRAPFGVILGNRLANSLGVIAGDKVRIIFPRGVRYTMAGKLPAERLFTVVAVFRFGSDADSTKALITLDSARRIMRMGDGFDGYRVWLEDPFTVDDFEENLPESVVYRDWRSERGELFQAIAMEKKMMALMLFLIVFVAAFNILSSLIMMVMDKTGEIAILRTMGLKSITVMAVFVSQGMVCGILGTVLGIAGGLLAADNLNEILGWLGLSDQFLLGAPLPVLIQPYMVVLIAFCSLLLSALSTLYPSYKASKVLPAEVLRYE